MVKKKTVSTEPKKIYKWGFEEEQDMLIFVWMWSSLKTIQSKCKEAIRLSKSIEEAAEKILEIAISETSPRASKYDEIIEYYNKKANWIKIVSVMKEKMAVN